VFFPFSISKTESEDVIMMMNNKESTKCLPGQTRFPNPNADVNTGSSRTLPSGFRNCSGLKESGSGYMTGSYRSALHKSRSQAERSEPGCAPCIDNYQRT